MNNLEQQLYYYYIIYWVTKNKSLVSNSCSSTSMTSSSSYFSSTSSSSASSCRHSPDRLSQKSRSTSYLHYTQNQTSKKFYSCWPYLSTTPGFSRCGPSDEILYIVSTLTSKTPGHLVLYLGVFYWSVN